jgi:predicted DsbA family dithiol-disulfide isomerase
MSESIKIEVWSDIACPWCYIGKRRLEAGIAAYAGDPTRPPVEVEYHSFQLSPDMPADFEGSVTDYLVRAKRLSESQVRAMLDRVTGIALEEGLHYHFGAVRHTNTMKAHQLLHYAKAHGVQAEAKERLLRAYFVEGRHVGRPEDLADLAAEIGLDRDEALRSLLDDQYLGAVDADQRLAAQYGIQAVPFFVIDGRYGVSGAQPAEVFAEALAKVAGERDEAAA